MVLFADELADQCAERLDGAQHYFAAERPLVSIAGTVGGFVDPAFDENFEDDFLAQRALVLA